MLRNVTLTIALLVGCTWCFVLATRADSAQPAAGGFKPVASIHGLMDGQNLLFSKIQELLGDPKAQKRHEQLAGYAEALAELANVNVLKKDKEDYRGFASELRDTSLELAGEASKKQAANDAKMNELFTKIKNTCAACHDAYQ